MYAASVLAMIVIRVRGLKRSRRTSSTLPCGLSATMCSRRPASRCLFFDRAERVSLVSAMRWSSGMAAASVSGPMTAAAVRTERSGPTRSAR